MSSKRLLPIAAAALIAACSTTPTPEPPSLALQVQEDNRIGPLLIQRFEPNIKLRSDKAVNQYLKALAAQVVRANPDLGNSEVSVAVVNDHKKKKWRNFSLPGIRIYLSANVLRRVEFENELVAVMAFEFAHILNRHIARRLEELSEKIAAEGESPGQGVEKLFPKTVTSDQPAGAFYFTEAQIFKSVGAAVRVLYDSGYDPRGLVTLWKLYLKNQKDSPFSKELLTKMVEETYYSIAQYSPLRNPIVRTHEFIAVKGRLRKL